MTQSLTTGQPVAGSGGSDAVADAFDRLDRAARIAGDDPDLLMGRAEEISPEDPGAGAGIDRLTAPS